MARYDHLPIWRDANRLLVLVEDAVRRFPRYHKYTVGTDLRRQAMTEHFQLHPCIIALFDVE